MTEESAYLERVDEDHGKVWLSNRADQERVSETVSRAWLLILFVVIRIIAT